MGDLAALEICVVSIQLALCMLLGTLCILLSHLYSFHKLLENASFKLEPQYERSALPRIFWSSGGVGQELGQGGGRNVRDYYLLLFI